MPRKNSKKEKLEPPGTPAWMVTYGDMMTLLMVFFVMLVAFSTIEKIKFKAAMGSLQGALMPWQPKPSGKAVVEPVTVNLMDQTQLEAMEAIEEIQEMVEEAQLTKEVEVHQVAGGVRIVFSDPVLFDEGKDELRTDALPILAKLADVAKRADTGEILIEGHTDDTPIHTQHFPSNWELSAARALQVLKFLQASGFSPERLAAVGYGEYRPRVKMPKTATKEEKAPNRRVEIFLKMSSEGRKILSSSGILGDGGWGD